MRKNNKKVAVIGAGPSGIILAIKLSKYMDVTIFEKMPKVGKKLIASGNGKCNLTSLKVLNKDVYNSKLAYDIYSSYTPVMFREDLLKYGIVTYEDIEHRVYPITNSSNTVVDNFLYHLEQNNVMIKLNTIVTDIIRKNNGYDIITSDSEFKNFDYVVVATGGKSNKQLGSNGEGYQLLNKLGIGCTKLYPGLVGLKVNKDEIIGLEGIRQKAKVYLFDNNEVIFEEFGEVQFKKDGISGIVIMNASSIIARKQMFPKLYLDLVPTYSHDKLVNDLKLIKKYNNNIDNLRLLKAVLPKMLAQNIYNKFNKFRDSSIEELALFIKHMPLTINGTYDFDASQVTVGGIDTNEVSSNLELKKYPNMYILGELLDVDGLCGGYNLHFAFASGTIASLTILKKEGIINE